MASESSSNQILLIPNESLKTPTNSITIPRPLHRPCSSRISSTAAPAAEISDSVPNIITNPNENLIDALATALAAAELEDTAPATYYSRSNSIPPPIPARPSPEDVRPRQTMIKSSMSSMATMLVEPGIDDNDENIEGNTDDGVESLEKEIQKQMLLAISPATKRRCLMAQVCKLK